MVQMPREVPPDVRVEITGLDDDDPRTEGWKLLERRIARVIAAEVETRVARERETFHMTLAHLAERYGEPSPTGMILRIPDAALLQDCPTVDVWREPATELAGADHTVYRFRRPRSASG